MLKSVLYVYATVFIVLISSVIYFPIAFGAGENGTIPGTIPETSIGGEFTLTGIVVTENPVILRGMPTARALILELVGANLVTGEVVFIKENLLSGGSFTNNYLSIGLHGDVLRANSLSGTWVISVRVIWI